MLNAYHTILRVFASDRGPHAEVLKVVVLERGRSSVQEQVIIPLKEALKLEQATNAYLWKESNSKRPENLALS